MNLDTGERTYTSQRFLELLLVICIVGFLATTYISIAEHYVKKARLTAKALPEVRSIQHDIIFRRAITGEWPEDYSAEEDPTTNPRLPFILQNVNWTDVKGVSVVKGGIHLNLGKNDLRFLDGEVLSFRNGVSAADPLGPVIWVVSTEKDYPGWIFKGKDRTTVDPKNIPDSWE